MKCLIISRTRAERFVEPCGSMRKEESLERNREDQGERGRQPDARMIHTYGQKKGAATRAVDEARRDMEADVYSKLGEDGGMKMICKMARDRDENSKDVNGGTVIKDRNGKFVTEQEAVLNLLQGATEPGRKLKNLELPSCGNGSGGEWNQLARQSTRGVADRANCPNLEEEGRCAKSREILTHHTSKSHHEAAREEPVWEDPKESRARIG